MAPRSLQRRWRGMLSLQPNLPQPATGSVLPGTLWHMYCLEAGLHRGWWPGSLVHKSVSVSLACIGAVSHPRHWCILLYRCCVSQGPYYGIMRVGCRQPRPLAVLGSFLGANCLLHLSIAFLFIRCCQFWCFQYEFISFYSTTCHVGRHCYLKVCRILRMSGVQSQAIVSSVRWPTHDPSVDLTPAERYTLFYLAAQDAGPGRTTDQRENARLP